MFELILGFVLTWPFIVAAVIFGIIAESNDLHGWSVFCGIIAAVVAFFYFHVVLADIAIMIVAYFIAGFVWSFWRYKRFCDKLVAEYANSHKSAKERAIETMKPTNMLDKITTWVIVWPFSMIENVAGDVINLVQTTITKFFKGIYSRIYENAAGKLAIVEQPTSEK